MVPLLGTRSDLEMPSPLASAKELARRLNTAVLLTQKRVLTFMDLLLRAACGSLAVTNPTVVNRL